MHVGNVELDVGTEDQTDGDAKTIAKKTSDHKDSDSEFQEQMPNTVDSVAGVQKFITEPDDKRCVGDSNVRSEAGRQHPRIWLQHAKSQSRGTPEGQSKRLRTDRKSLMWKLKSGRPVTTSSFSWTRTSSHRPALEVGGKLGTT